MANKYMKNIIQVVSIFVLVPLISFAETGDPSSMCQNIQMKTLGGIINWASCTLIKLVVPLLFALATVGFIWGIIQYFINPDNEEARKKGKSYMIWGIIALFVMLCMWGLVGVLTKTFGIQTLIPQLSQ